MTGSALPKADGGLGLGTAETSIIFLGAILATVIYLTITRRDVIEDEAAARARAARPAPRADHARLLRRRGDRRRRDPRLRPRPAALDRGRRRGGSGGDVGNDAAHPHRRPRTSRPRRSPSCARSPRTRSPRSKPAIRPARRTDRNQLETAWDDDQSTLRAARRDSLDASSTGRSTPSCRRSAPRAPTTPPSWSRCTPSFSPSAD